MIKRTILVAVCATSLVFVVWPATAQQAVMPSAPAAQEPQPATQSANEQIILQELTAYRDQYAKAISYQAWAQGLSKQNDELRAKLAESQKKENEALAEVAELKGRAAGKAQQTPMPPKQ